MNDISSAAFKTWERFYRANFINSLTGFKSVSLIGTVNKKGQCNLGVFSSVVHIGSDPALVGYINRPRKAAPHTLANIEATGSYTINHIHADFLPQAHQTSAKYSEEINEFEAVGLTSEFDENSIAPFVKESKVKYALTLKEIIPISFNNTFLVIGEIQHVKIDSEIITDDGFLTLEKIGSLCSNGIDSYYTTQLVDRFKYAKPDLRPEKL
jgi:flavin reductase (DIM6/NTAB) family NADH-FMN oxidoreductase RutF